MVAKALTAAIAAGLVTVAARTTRHREARTRKPYGGPPPRRGIGREELRRASENGVPDPLYIASFL
jgi:hypothetical protein